METPLARDPGSEPTRWTRARVGACSVVVWSAWAVVTLAAILYIQHFARNLPFMDDFAIVPVMTGHEPLSLRWAFSQHNEHRMVIPKVILATLYRAIPDFRAGLYLNAGLLSTASASMILLARRLRGWTSITDAVLPLSILNIGQSECFLIGFALNLVLTAWISYVLIVAMCRTSQSPGWWPSLLVGGLLVLLPLSGGSGLVMLPPLMLWLAGYVACGWWSGRDPGAWGRALGLGLLLTTLVVVAFYLKGYERPGQHPAIPSAWAACSTTLEFLSLVIRPVGLRHWHRLRTALGVVVALLAAVTLIRLAIIARRSSAERLRAFGLIAALLSLLGVAAAVGVSRSGYGSGFGLKTPPGVVVALLAAITLIRLAIVARRSPAERPRAFGLIAVLLSLLGVAATVGVSRSGYGSGFGLSSRYISISAPLLSVFYIAWLLYGPNPARRAIHIGLLALVCAGIPFNALFALRMGEDRRDFYIQVERSLRAGLPASLLMEQVIPGLNLDPGYTYKCFKMLKAARVGMFRYFVDDKFSGGADARAAVH